MNRTRFRNRLIATLLLLLILLAPTGAAGKERIALYTVNDGLSQHSVTSITQDGDKMLWVGTFDGLNRFDGRSFRNFRHSPDDSLSIANNRILSVQYDNEEGLWILYANNHVGKYLGEGRFRNFHLPANGSDLGNENRAMTICDSYLMICGGTKGIILFKTGHTPDSERIIRLKRFIEERERDDEFILSVGKTAGTLWISTTKGVWCCSETGRFEQTNHLGGYNLVTSEKGYVLLWQAEQLVVCNAVHNPSERTMLHEVARYRLPARIQTAVPGRNGEFWIGTMVGLFKTHDSQLMGYPPELPVRTLFCDNLGVIWCGGLNGLQSINPHVLPIENIRFSGERFSLENHINVMAVSPENDHLWVGVMQRGLQLLRLDTASDGEKSGTKEQFFFKGLNPTMICPYSPDTLVVGTNNGLKMLVRRNGSFREVAVRSDGIKWVQQPFRGVKQGRRIYLTNGKRIYGLSFEQGTPVFDRLPAINAALPKRSVIMALEMNPRDSSLWVGYRGDGVYRILLRDNSVVSLDSLAAPELTNRYVWDIFTDSRERIYIGTDAGLNLLYRDETSQLRLRSVSIRDGMRNDKIETIEEDTQGNIWAGTSQGIVCLNPQTFAFTIYDSEDGFQSNNFTSASLRTDDGYLLFGGIDGISLFRPEAFSCEQVTPSLHIARISAGGNVIPTEEWDEISLPNKYKDIKIVLESYYSPNPGKITYKFALNDNLWNEVSTNEILLNDLRPGRYVLALRSCAGPGNESPEKRIEFSIRRPLLLSYGAFTLYALLLIAVSWMVIRSTLSRKLLDNRLKMEEELRETENRMNTEKLNFYTNMAHEIKTPLSLILGRIYDIENCDEASPYIVRKAKLIGDNAHIIKELTEQILEFKRAVSGKLELEIQEIDIMPGIRQIIDNYLDYAGKRGIALRLESSSDSIVKHIDMQKIIRILYNLLSNAIKFSERDDTILVKVVEKPDSLVLIVSDTGSGISEEDIPHIFERFYKSGKAGGSGIGLAFTKSLIDLMGGEISVSSRLGSGSTFIVTIPDHPGSGNAPEAKIIDTPVAEQLHATPSVLLVEDNVELNEYIAEILSVRFKVFKTYDAKEALQTLKKEPVDIILSDVMMPGCDGVELARKIKGVKNYAHIPIVFLSAKSAPEDQLVGLQTGAVDYITKPFNPHILLIKVQNILTQYYLSKENFKETRFTAEAEPQPRNWDEIFINKAREIIYGKMSDEEFGVHALSQEMGISRVHLTREFQRIINQSPSTFIKSIRLNYARHLLLSGNISIKEVLWEIGIRSHSGFTKAFKEEFGYLPSQITKEPETGSQNEENTKHIDHEEA